MQHSYSGKVRDLYTDGDDLIMVASDRVSIYDVVLPTPIPDKGKLLNQLAAWWFGRTEHIVGNHVISTEDVPEEFRGRAVRCKRLEMLRVECIVRGYLTGLGLREYQRDGAISGVRLPDGLVEGDQLPEPIFTPTTKAEQGHDEFITFADVADQIGAELANRLRDYSIQVYTEGAAYAKERGVLIADTKFEFGLDADGNVLLADEILTPDSSRFWNVDEWQPGGPQRSYDKQLVRDWASGTGWDKTAPGPEIPADIAESTSARYREVYERITGTTWNP
ncbi:phosphoribosylaminoimidazolesuccinocarboxamide synthase [Sciscionella sediminilitoris]|uniref:phosphoribosylaminoimidazolesuccinocarboxamide synthase n=1 Tax=Sciscionella sediminilitoris TaxID=1445613 RepID=UPI0004DF37F8|nr:phosphoribosylaminoimidazolesuccinocarboxamide synthase [Sciscionella sp. SE31]